MASKASAKNAGTTLTFTKERETKNTVRYSEDVEGDAQAVVGTLYVSKTVAANLGESITVTIQ